MLDRMNRDEMFYRILDEKSDALLKDLRSVENPNFQDREGTSYLHMACQSHYVEAIRILLERGADPNISDKRGFSPIMLALGSINEKNEEIFQLMLEYGLNLNKIENGITLKEMIESFDEDNLNALIRKYYKEN